MFGVFFNIGGIFGGVQFESEPTFSILVHIYFKNGKRLELPISTPGGD